MATDLRGALAELQPLATAAWGPAAAYDLELRVEPLAELAAAKATMAPEQWSAALADFFAGPKPRAVAPALLAILRRRARAVPVARVVETTAFVPAAPQPAVPSRYHAALERLLGACAGPTRVQ